MGSANFSCCSRNGLFDLFSWLLSCAFVVSCCWVLVKPRPFSLFHLLSSFQAVFNSTGTEQKQLHKHMFDSAAAPISGTSITGTSVISFHRHLHCMSESGRWVYNATPRHIPWDYVAESYLDRCDQNHRGLKGKDAEQPFLTPQNWTVREGLKWAWRTNETCPTQPIDRDEFCKLIGERGNLMVVGDSINHGLQWSIINNLIKDPDGQVIVKDGYPVCRTCPGYRICGDVLGKGKEFSVSFIRNDRLSAINRSRYDRGNFLEWPWMDYIEKWAVKILVLNRGAHYEEDEIVLDALNSTFSYIKERHPELLVFFRNTPPGHLNCMKHKGPLEKRQNLSTAAVYDWGKFQWQNLLVKELVEKFGFIYVDAYAMLSLRADGHVREGDCLHYCVPGPLDSVVELLYNIFKIIPRFN